MRRQKILPVLAVALMLSTGCGSDDDAADAPSADATTTTEAGVSSDERFPGGLRDVRYCEVLLLIEEPEAFVVEVYNTLGLSDCPQADWDALDADALGAERDATVALLNGPRFWTLDTIVQLEERERVEVTFGAIPMFLAATVDLGNDLPTQTPYTERSVARETIFRFDAGTEVHELTDPDGRRYVMQSYSHAIDDTQTLATLAGLGDRLALPAGWTFATRTLDAQLDLLSADGVATVIQDDLQNTYQRIEPGVDE
jgi:hypothetical protein